MVLCRNCAHTTWPGMLSCPRCAFTLPYWRSKRWRGERELPGMTGGKHCPRCGCQTTRQPSPLWLKPVRLFTLHRCSYRSCSACGWHGAAFHGRTHGAATRA